MDNFRTLKRTSAVCIGAGDKTCTNTYVPTSPSQKRCAACAVIARDLRQAAYRKMRRENPDYHLVNKLRDTLNEGEAEEKTLTSVQLYNLMTRIAL